MYLRAHDMFDFSYVMQNRDQIYLDIHSLQPDVLLLIFFHFQQYYRGTRNQVAFENFDYLLLAISMSGSLESNAMVGIDKATFLNQSKVVVVDDAKNYLKILIQFNSDALVEEEEDYYCQCYLNILDDSLQQLHNYQDAMLQSYLHLEKLLQHYTPHLTILGFWFRMLFLEENVRMSVAFCFSSQLSPLIRVLLNLISFSKTHADFLRYFIYLVSFYSTSISPLLTTNAFFSAYPPYLL